MNQEYNVQKFYNEPPDKGFAIAALVLGILSIVCIFVHFPFAAPLGIIGIILATIAKSKGQGGGMATAGLICSIIGIVFPILLCTICAACLVPFMVF